MWTKLVMILSAVMMASAYPKGPPKSVCKDGMPYHVKDGKPVPPQNTTSPFVITVNSTVIRPGDTIRVKVHSNQGEMFRGLFLQVHPIPNSADDQVKYEAAGLFDRKLKNVKITSCRTLMDTIAHKHAFMKIEAIFDWRAPLILKRNVVVRATILKNFDTYWHDVQSSTIMVLKDETTEVKNLEKPWLQEIIKTIQSEEDMKARRDVVRARFERGFRNAINRNGIIMVNFVTNLLPFEDSNVPRIQSLNQSVHLKGESIDFLSEASNITQSAENVTVDNVKSVDNVSTSEEAGKNVSTSENMTNTNGSSVNVEKVHGEEFTIGEDDLDHHFADTFNGTFDMSHQKNTPMMERYYEVLVKSLLKGDKMVADILSEIIGNN